MQRNSDVIFYTFLSLCTITVSSMLVIISIWIQYLLDLEVWLVLLVGLQALMMFQMVVVVCLKALVVLQKASLLELGVSVEELVVSAEEMVIFAEDEMVLYENPMMVVVEEHLVEEPLQFVSLQVWQALVVWSKLALFYLLYQWVVDGEQ